MASESREKSRDDPALRAPSVDEGATAERLCRGERTKRLLFVKDLGRMFPELGADTIYALLKSGEIAGRIVGGKWATTPEAVDAWLDRITAGGATASSLRVVR